MRLGIICPSEIALRRFLPAVKNFPSVEFAGVGMYSAAERFGEGVSLTPAMEEKLCAERKKAEAFIALAGGKIYDSYAAITGDPSIDALYIPLPPALHGKWAKKALEAGKHVLLEKPAALNAADAAMLCGIAKERGLALHENYMFAFHAQLSAVQDVVKSGELGEVRLMRVSFGFPRRAANDFRYDKAMGGGALLDAGGYTLKYAGMLLGDSCRVAYAQMNYSDEFSVDLYGSGALVNDAGQTVQIAYGMDNSYKCELEIWGSKGCLSTGRILTAPAGFAPTMTVRVNNTDEVRSLPADDAFGKSIAHFLTCCADKETRENTYAGIIAQAKRVEEFWRMANGR